MNLIESLQIEAPRDERYYMHCKNELRRIPQTASRLFKRGATLAFAEIISGMMSNELIGPDKFSVGQSITANHLRPVRCEGALTELTALLVKENIPCMAL